MTILNARGVPVSTAQNLGDNSEAAIRRRSHDFANVPPPSQPLNPKTALVHAYYRAGLDRTLLLFYIDAERERLSRMVNHYIAGCTCPQGSNHDTCRPHGYAGEMQDPDHYPLCADHDHIDPTVGVSDA